MSYHALPPYEAADDERPDDDAADEHGNIEDDDAELVIKLNPCTVPKLSWSPCGLVLVQLRRFAGIR